jgi:hypothetical protein
MIKFIKNHINNLMLNNTTNLFFLNFITINNQDKF